MIEIKKDEKKQTVDLTERGIYQGIERRVCSQSVSVEQIEKDLQHPFVESYIFCALESKFNWFSGLFSQILKREVLQIAVKKAYQGKKIATALFEHSPINKDFRSE